jgi:hypothetical protein
VGYAALWVVVAIEGLLISFAVIRQSRRAESGERKPKTGTLEELIGQKLPVLSVSDPVISGGEAITVKSSFCDGSLVFFVTSNCVSSHRLLRTLALGVKCSEPAMSIICAVIGSAQSSLRMLETAGMRSRSVLVLTESFGERYGSMLPFAVSVSSGEIVIHAGKVDTLAALEKFIEASRSRDAREWFSKLMMAERFASLERADK